MHAPVRLLILCSLLLPAVVSANSTPVAAVFSTVANGYSRSKLPDQSFKPETYVFGEGERLQARAADPSLEGIDFLEIAHTLAGPLADQNYVQSRDPASTDLLIVIDWGATIGARDSQDATKGDHAVSALTTSRNFEGCDFLDDSRNALDADLESEAAAALVALNVENRFRDNLNHRNAGILGFRAALDRAQALPHVDSSRSLLESLELDRYVVVLKAYDFQHAWKTKRQKLLWETRFSINKRGNRFDQQLHAMALQASRQFGRNTGGLLQRPLPKAEVEIGEAKFIGYDNPSR